MVCNWCLIHTCKMTGMLCSNAHGLWIKYVNISDKPMFCYQFYSKGSFWWSKTVAQVAICCRTTVFCCSLLFACNDRISESLIFVFVCTVYVVITCLLHTIALFVHAYGYMWQYCMSEMGFTAVLDGMIECSVMSIQPMSYCLSVKTAVRSWKLQLFTIPESHYACLLPLHCGKIHNWHCFIVMTLGHNRITVLSCVQSDDSLKRWTLM